MTSAVEHEIRIGRLEPGRRIPGEYELARRFQVSQGTVRQAPAILARCRLIRTHPGAGSYVEFGHERLEYSLGWSAALARHGAPTSSRVLRLEVVELPELATRVGSPSVRFVAVDRVRMLASGEPVSLERGRLPLSTRTRRLLHLDFSNASLTAALHRTGLVPVSSEEWVYGLNLPQRLVATAVGVILLLPLGGRDQPRRKASGCSHSRALACPLRGTG